MKQVYGASIPEADISAIADYMSATYGPGNGSDEANVKVATPAGVKK